VAPTALRRAGTVPALLVAAAVSVAALIVAAVVTGPVCLCRRGRWRAVRLASFLAVYIAVEIMTLASALTLWIRSGPAARRDTERYTELNFRLMETALARLYRAARRLFRLQIEVTARPRAARAAAADMSPRPVIVLSRHAGPGDSFLLVYGLLAHAKRRPLIVLKRALILDPWIDVILGRIPHCFVRPGGGEGDSSGAQIGALAAAMGTRDALVLFPEGGNFTPGRRHRAIGRLRRLGQRKRASQARKLENVLPPRPTGVLAAVRGAPGADVTFVAHTGLDHMDSAAATWRGIPLSHPLRVTWWQVPAHAVPTGPDACADWLFAQWVRVDAWVGHHRGELAPG
jgi:1-acyl-sn-glycerol-3-phosphate acyltransferase